MLFSFLNIRRNGRKEEDLMYRGCLLRDEILLDEEQDCLVGARFRLLEAVEVKGVEVRVPLGNGIFHGTVASQVMFLDNGAMILEEGTEAIRLSGLCSVGVDVLACCVWIRTAGGEKCLVPIETEIEVIDFPGRYQMTLPLFSE